MSRDAPESSRRDGTERWPQRIGAYTIDGVLGKGEMGVVYRARQAHPDRVVALKVIRPGSLSRDVLRRFEHEVRVLGRLAHPGIARIHEAGTADAGDGAQPYFAMELVEGLPLLEHADGEGLDLRARLRLMAKVCDAVQHAHLSGVIHRDLKPANILVQDGQPKVLDFGVARATDADMQVTTVARAVDELVGTLSYMSPEQMTGEAETLDTRSDVYALGAVLYELLAGRVPHELAGKPLTEAIRIVREDDVRPLRALDARYRGDVDVIVAKALERDRERRYQSAGALGDDLRATLEHQPIEASHPGPLVRVRKWTRRNPTLAVAAAGVLVVAAVLGAQSAASARNRRAEAASILADACTAATAYEAERGTVEQIEDEAGKISAWSEYGTEDQSRSRDRRRAKLAEQRRAHDDRFNEADDLLGLAERLGADPAGVRSGRARLYLARSLEAQATGHREERDQYERLTRQNDPRDELASALRPKTAITLDSDPAGASVYVFAIREQSDLFDGGEPRLVPVPIGNPELPVPPGTFGLRVVGGRGVLDPLDVIFEVAGRPIRNTVLVAEGRGDVRRLDRLVVIDDQPVQSAYEIRALGREGTDGSGRALVRRFEFERAGRRFAVEGTSLAALGVAAVEPRALAEHGDVPVRVWRHGEVVAMTLPAGLDLRTTSIPFFTSEAALVGRTPIETSFERGQYVAIFRRAGFEDQRQIFIMPEQRGSYVSMAPAGTTPAGFVRVLSRSANGAEDPATWIMEHEVTLETYIEFLNDARTLAEIDASDAPIRVPRLGDRPLVARDDDGRFRRVTRYPGHEAGDASGDWPVLGVSWHDARAFARWKTDRARAEGLDHTYGLPRRRLDWAVGVRDVPYLFGSVTRRTARSASHGAPERILHCKHWC